MLVSICVATFQRPQGLKRLLQSLNCLKFQKSEQPEIEVVIVDNHASGSAEAIINEIRVEFNWQLKYTIEQRQGISFARNQAIASCAPHTDFIAFIDDDETAEPSWLDELLVVQQKFNADVVWGPNLPKFVEDNVPNWVTKGRFFDPPRYPTGHLLKYAATNNVLIRKKLLEDMNVRFEERFALTGGEDTYLFMSARRAGYKLIWADEAITYEWVPQSRTQMKWILQRGFRGSSTFSICERELYPTISVILLRTTTGLGRIIWGTCLVAASLFGQRHLLVKGLLRICQGSGLISGLAGFQHVEYKTVHGV
jgi:glycosyltransferase involved in cell wall biosynthesis